MPRFVSEFNVGLSLKLTKRKWYHLRQPLRLKLQPLPSCRWLQMKNFCCQPDRKNMKICCTEEKHRAAESREFWQILHCASDKWHWRRDADTVGCEEITCQFVSPKSFSEQNVTQLFWAGLFFYFSFFFFPCRKYSLLSKLVWCYWGVPECYVFQVCPGPWPAWPKTEVFSSKQWIYTVRWDHSFKHSYDSS